jgi:hypothetical protein
VAAGVVGVDGVAGVVVVLGAGVLGVAGVLGAGLVAEGADFVGVEVFFDELDVLDVEDLEDFEDDLLCANDSAGGAARNTNANEAPKAYRRVVRR